MEDTQKGNKNTNMHRKQMKWFAKREEKRKRGQRIKELKGRKAENRKKKEIYSIWRGNLRLYHFTQRRRLLFILFWIQIGTIFWKYSAKHSVTANWFKIIRVKRLQNEGEKKVLSRYSMAIDSISQSKKSIQTSTSVYVWVWCSVQH